MLALFRCDASPSMGTGHVMRCMTVARELASRGWTCDFATSCDTIDAVPSILEFNRVDPLRVLDGESAYDVVVIDGYHLDQSVERAMRSIGDRCVVFDDLPNRDHDCDMLVDQTLGRDPLEYKDRVPDYCKVLAGSSYALLRPEFHRWRSTAIERRSSRAGRIDRLLVSMGGTDADNVAGAILEVLADVGSPAEVAVLSNSTAAHFEELVDRCRSLTTAEQTFSVAADVADIAEVMTHADLAVGAAGTTSWERATLGLPSLLVSTASNQIDVASALHAAGAARNLGRLGPESLRELAVALREMLEVPERVKAMSRSAVEVCDGRGVHRVIPEIVSATVGSIGLRTAGVEDSETLFDWQQGPGVRRYSRNPRAPTRTEHDAWLNGVLNDADRQLYVVVRDEAPVGMLRLDRRPRKQGSDRSFEISILVDPSASGQGVASAALRAVRRLEPKAEIWAFVLPENEVSRRLFLRAGYVGVDSGWFVQRIETSCAAGGGGQV